MLLSRRAKTKERILFIALIVIVAIYIVLNSNLHDLYINQYILEKGNKQKDNKLLIRSMNLTSFKKTKFSEKNLSTRFEERDMLDEFGKPFIILLRHERRGPSYLANPKECLSNISCQIIYDRNQSITAHAVVFSYPYGTFISPTTKRYPHQLYVWRTEESPLQPTNFPSSQDGLFNLTFHYRTDADVYAPYGSINLILRELKAAGETDLEALLEKKRNSNKIAAWAVSNCRKTRMKYAKSLKDAGLQVDFYGSCFGGRELGKGKYSKSFYNELSKYKFYFAFENSISCRDYITEKFWFNSLFAGAVPIVWGPDKNDILKVAPTKSFIHTSDFLTPKRLVYYLYYLARNETAYAEYLQWRTWVNHPERIEERLRMENRDNDLRSFCKLCSILQEDARNRRLGLPTNRRIHKSVAQSWRKNEQRCH